MAEQISVEEILAEIDRLSNKDAKIPSSSDLAHVDDIIRDILTEKREEKLGVKKESLSPEELGIFEEIIDKQTKTLTMQFEKLRRAEAEASREEPLKELSEEPKEEAAVVLEADIPLENTEQDSKVNPDVAEAFSDFEHAIAAFTDSDIREKGESGSQITPSDYIGYKSRRSHRVGNFNLDPAQPPQEETPEAPAPEAAPVDPFEGLEEEEGVLEYESTAQNEDVDLFLHRNYSRARWVPYVLGVLTALSLFFCYHLFTGESIRLLLGVTMPMRAYLWTQSAILGLGIIVNGAMFRELLSGIFNRQASKSGFCAAASLMTLAYQLLLAMLPQRFAEGGIQIYAPAAMLVLLANAISRLQNAKRMGYNFEQVQKEHHITVETVEEIPFAKSMTQGMLPEEEEPLLAKNVPARFTKGFFKDNSGEDASDRLMQKTFWIAFALGIALTAFRYFVTRDILASVQFLPSALLLWHGMLGAVLVSQPLWGAVSVLNEVGGVVPGPVMMKEFGGVNTAMVEAEEIFNDGSVVLHGIKTFQGKRIDYAIVDAASAVCASGSILQHIFLEMINQRRELLKPVDTIQYEDRMGFSAWVDNRRVLIGNRELLINHSVAVPKAEYEEKFRQNGQEVVYLATEGELCAAFIISFNGDYVQKDAMQTFTENGVSVLIRTVDACVTADLVSELFDVQADRFGIVPSRFHRDWEQEHTEVETSESLLCNDGSPLGFAITAVMPQKLRRCVNVGEGMHFVAGIFASIFLLFAALLGHPEWLSGYVVSAFIVWFGLIFWIYQKNIRI